jgi:hypothetical protein
MNISESGFESVQEVAEALEAVTDVAAEIRQWRRQRALTEVEVR